MFCQLRQTKNFDKMTATKIKLQYSLKWYVRDYFSKDADKRGGQAIEYPKRGKRAIKTYLSLDIMDSQSILKAIRFPFSNN